MSKWPFRNLGIKKKHWHFLIMKARCPSTGKWKFFVEKAVPFGSSISCSHFQHVSNAVAHIVRFRTKHDNVNYLDDYLFASLIKAICNGQVRVFMDICNAIALPVNIEKTFWGTTLLTFLGMLLDTENQTVSIPTDKIEK